MISITTFANKTVAVFGLGGSGLATATALLAGGAHVAAWDDGAAGRAAAETARVPLVDLNAADWSQFAALVLAPGVPLTHPVPHWTVVKARAAGVEVIGDIELFCRERNKLAPDAPFLAITGTNGKSTTTALIAHILREAGKDVQIGGNIGVPILALEPLTEDRIYVIEMSSFQIDLTPSVNPTVGVLLNITPDHLDRHGPADDLELAMSNYAAIKERLVAASIFSVIGVDNGIGTSESICEKIFHELEFHHGKPVLAFSRERAQRTTIVYFEPPSLHRAISMGDRFCFDETLLNLAAARALRGSHNAENAAAAFIACEREGIPHDEIGAGIKTFPGLPHRMEEIGRVGDVLFINDSKATNADSTEKALASFPRDVFWILGGKPKEGGIESLRPYFPGVVKAYLIGAASDEFAATLDGDVAIVRCGTLDVAVAMAARDAAVYAATHTVIPAEAGTHAAQSERIDGLRSALGSEKQDGPNLAEPALGPGLRRDDESAGKDALAVRQPVVLLSPSCASYDQFANFEKRGDAFRALVMALPGFVARTTTQTEAPDA
jgi:UDP-N-acetylmuramoylalanine--D-glutamate ligase